MFTFSLRSSQTFEAFLSSFGVRGDGSVSGDVVVMRTRVVSGSALRVDGVVSDAFCVVSGGLHPGISGGGHVVLELEQGLLGVLHCP